MLGSTETSDFSGMRMIQRRDEPCSDLHPHFYPIWKKIHQSYVNSFHISFIILSLSIYTLCTHIHKCIDLCMYMYMHIYIYTHLFFFPESFEGSCMPHVLSLLNTSMGRSKSKCIFFCNVNTVVRFRKFNIDPILFYNLYSTFQYCQLSH